VIDFRHGKHQKREDQDDDGRTQGVLDWEFILIVGAYKYYKYRYIILSRLFYDQDIIIYIRKGLVDRSEPGK
jgi:hypothetical protein